MPSRGSGSVAPDLVPELAHPEAGIDTLRVLFETRDFGGPAFEIDEADGWRFGSIPGLGLTWAEGHPQPGALAGSRAVAEAAEQVRQVIHQRFGVVRDRGVARSDQTVTRSFSREQDARAFFAGMSAVQLPRTETTRRGHPVHSISWSAPNGRRILARCYDKGLERGGEAFKFGRLEDQRRYPSGGRPTVEAVSDPEYARQRFVARFGPVRKAVTGVKAATFPVIAQALADEARYGYRSVREVERLAGSLVVLCGGASEAYSRRSFYRRKAELKEAGYVVVDDLTESVEVNLGELVEEAMEASTWE